MATVVSNLVWQPKLKVNFSTFLFDSHSCPAFQNVSGILISCSLFQGIFFSGCNTILVFKIGLTYCFIYLLGWFNTLECLFTFHL